MDMPKDTRVAMAQANVEMKARELCLKLAQTMTRQDRELYLKLAQTMTRQDREKGFDEWDNLGDALKALSRAREA